MNIPAPLAQLIDFVRNRRTNGAEPQGHPGPVGPQALSKGTHNELTPITKDEKELVSFVVGLHDRWHQARYPYEVTWYLDIAYYLGLQWHSWSEAERGLREARSPSYRVRLVINRLMPLVRTLLGKVLRGMPKANVYPLQTSEQSYADARIGSKLLRGQWRSLSLEDAIAEWLLWVVLTGTGFGKVGFDPDIGEEVDAGDGSRIRLGEVCVDACSPFSILVPPTTLDLIRPLRLIETKMIDIEVLRTKYGDAVGELKPDGGGTKDNFYERRLAGLISPVASSSTVDMAEIHNSVYVSELWEDPEVLHPEAREEFPNGRVVVIAQQQAKLLSVHENPYRTWMPHESKLPYVRIRDDRIPGRFWGAGRIEQLMPIQKSYNKGRSQMVEARNLTCQPKITVEKGHGMGRITNEPGQILERTRGMMPPAFMNPPQISSFHSQDIEATLRDIEEVSQLSSASRGQLPSANVPGYAVELLQEADNTPLSPLVRQIADGYSRLFTKILERDHQFYDEERVIAYVGENNENDTVLFLADRHVTPLRAEVTPEAVMPESRASKMARILEVLKTFPGVFDPQRDRPFLFRLLEFGDVDQLWEDADLDRQKQGRENRKMMQGQPVPTDSIDDHGIHLAVINRFRKSPEWDTMDPRVKALFDQHATAHVQALLKSIQNVTSMPGKMQPQNPVANKGPTS